MTFRLYNILWNTDGTQDNLPREVLIDEAIDEQDAVNQVSDAFRWPIAGCQAEAIEVQS